MLFVRFLLLFPMFLGTPAGGQHPVINEFMASNSRAAQDESGDYDDWIEIYNPSSQPVDIGGMYLTDRLSNPTKWQVPGGSPAQTTIAAQGYLLIWADGETDEGILHADFKLSDAGEAIGLYDIGGTLVDSVAFGPQNADQSYGRFPDGAANWEVFNNPTPEQANRQDHPDVVINEIMYHPYADVLEAEATGEEFIELLNRGATAVSLDGWRFTKGVNFSFPDVVVGPGEYLVVAGDVDAFAGRYPEVPNVVGGWSGQLSNAGETVELRSAEDVVVDRVRYADNGDWSVRELGPVDHRHRGWGWRDDHDGGGKSLELVDAALPNEYGQNWAASDWDGGTPGVANSVAAAETLPLIGEVRHAPVVPGPADPVTITARVGGRSNMISDIRLRYRVDHSRYVDWDTYPQFDADDYAVVSMSDDGEHGDGMARDGLYGADVPPHPDGTVIEFYIEVRDGAGRSRTWPAPAVVDGQVEQATNALYRVDARFNPYAYWQIGSQPLYYMVMTEMERGRLATIGSRGDDALSRSRMNGTFISVDGQDILLRYNVGIRNRGKGSRTPPPNNYHVDIPHDRPWKGVSGINVNSKYTYFQLLGYTIFQMAGLPSLEAKRVQVRVNGEDLAPMDPGRMYGSYVHVEVYGGDWASRQYPDDSEGNLYRCVSNSRFTDLRYRGDDPAVYGQEGRYDKSTNSAANDWSDLIALTHALDQSPDETYVQDVEEAVHVDQWLRWLALQTLLTNKETNLSNGFADDYCMYRGVEDRRFVLLPYDLDNILNWSDPNTSIWLDGRLENLPVVARFLTHPEFVRRYYAQLNELAETVLAPERFGPLVEQVLGGWVPQQRIDAIKDFAAARRAYVLSVIPKALSVDCALRTGDGYFVKIIPYVNETDVHGTADAIATRSVLVNGVPVEWSPWEGQWVLGPTKLDLFPGINRIIAEAFDGPEGTGNQLARDYTDIYCRAGATNDYPQGGPGNGGSAAFATVFELSESEVWTGQEGPYRITADMVVPAGVTLTIGPGTTVFFDPGVTMVVRGRLLVEGTGYGLIRLTRTPELGGTWGGIQFVDSTEDNRICHAVIEYGRSEDGMIEVETSQLLLDHVTLDNTDSRCVRAVASSLVVRNSHFADVAGSDEPSMTDSQSEHIWVRGVPEDGQVVIEGNVLGETTGHSVAINLGGLEQPAVIPQILDNVFEGGGSALALETDTYVEGNVFTDCAEGQSAAILAGGGRDYVVVRNLFHGVERVARIAGGSFMQFENNTVVDVKAAVFAFDAPGLPSASREGVWVESCILWGCPVLGEGPAGIVMSRCLAPSAWHTLGEGNLDADPLFVGPEDFHLRSMSAARGAGLCGLDMGAYVPAGASVSGEPADRTHRRDATLRVGGPGITHYRYSVNDPDGPWSDERPVDVPILLTDLDDGGSYTVYAVGKNSAGVWQERPNASRSWTVDATYGRLVLNEILAANDALYEREGAFPDGLELYYDGPTAISLAGMSISDDPQEPEKFMFGAGVTMHPGDYLVVWGDGDSGNSGMELGFGLGAAGDAVYLYDRDGALLDSVVFGRQLPDFSIGRTGPDNDWRLTFPTLGQANVARPLGNPDTVKINEWLAGAQVLFVQDLVELYNPHVSPADLGGFRLTDNPTTQPDKYEMPPLSFVGGQGFAVFHADDVNGPGHLGFRLSVDGEMIGLLSQNGDVVDKVIYGPQTPDVSQGRAPDGGDHLDWLALPTPGLANPVVGEPIAARVTLVAENAEKRALVPVSADQVDENWKVDPDFDDSAWLPASGGVGYDYGVGYQDMISLDVGAQMYGFNTICYVRVPFVVEVSVMGRLDELLLSVRYDDAFVAYLNGVEVARANFLGEPQWDSFPDRNHEASYGAFDVVLDVSQYAGLLREGQNLLAIHAMNGSPTSSDFLISAALEATQMVLPGDEHPYLKELALLDGLRIAELMYHAEEGDDGDYVELRNIGDETLDLTGLRFTDGIQFTFGEMVLGPGEFVVVVDDVAEFRSVYGPGVVVAGEYTDRLSDRGEVVVLTLAAPWEAAIMRFRYEDGWYPTTDGDGQSLVIEEVTAAPVYWSDRESWRASPPTPGRP